VRIFKSLILPIKAIALGLLSISSTFGILAFVFNSKTLTNLLGLYQLDQLEVWALVFLFVLIFGLTMDYEVFITSRIREAWDNGLDNESAVMEGMRQTAGVVSAAGIIMIGAVSGLILGSFAGLQEIGVGIAVGVLVDITLIRLMLLPSLMILLGKWNWWLPESIAKTLKLKPSALKI
jgi:RND superfamily putative drug exporter